jgi:putative addiction module component (TIGR02574 family)
MAKEYSSTEILDLPAAERLSLVEAIWDSLAAEPSKVPVPDWHAAELDRRLARHEADRDAVRPWDEVKARLSTPPAKKRRKS